jgi:hypothetical protein
MTVITPASPPCCVHQNAAAPATDPPTKPISTRAGRESLMRGLVEKLSRRMVHAAVSSGPPLRAVA